MLSEVGLGGLAVAMQYPQMRLLLSCELTTGEAPQPDWRMPFWASWGCPVQKKSSGGWCAPKPIHASHYSTPIGIPVGHQCHQLTGLSSVYVVHLLEDRWVYADTSWARIAALVPVVKACAKAGDEVARGVLEHAVEELACSVKAVVGTLNLNGIGRCPDWNTPFEHFVSLFFICWLWKKHFNNIKRTGSTKKDEPKDWVVVHIIQQTLRNVVHADMQIINILSRLWWLGGCWNTRRDGICVSLW